MKRFHKRRGAIPRRFVLGLVRGAVGGGTLDAGKMMGRSCGWGQDLSRKRSGRMMMFHIDEFALWHPGRGVDFDLIVVRWFRCVDPQPPATGCQASGLGEGKRIEECPEPRSRSSIQRGRCRSSGSEGHALIRPAVCPPQGRAGGTGKPARSARGYFFGDLEATHLS
jgi:hypothetical protein